MSSSNRGQGVRKFWEARASGAEVDVKAIFEEHPDEALELADAIREAASQEDSVARERMWLARAQILNRSGEDVDLGSTAPYLSGERGAEHERSQFQSPRTGSTVATNGNRSTGS